MSKCCKFLANLCKSSEIIEQCHDYRIYGSVSYSFSCTDIQYYLCWCSGSENIQKCADVILIGMVPMSDLTFGAQ